ncbi:hypothetical protein [Flavobacterium notoginsengisoli]|uniref:hypothetical protein n=1 Tax=Flavobacterium notoginsengisoli TaxID=1478199 RepID=UPI003624C7D8
MNLQKIKVYHLFWIVSLLIVIIGITQNNNLKATLDINIHDTYFVVRNSDATIFLFVCYFLIGLGYWLVQKVFKKRLVKYLTIIHSSILIGSFIFYWMVVLLVKLQLNDRTYNYSDDHEIINIILIIEFLITIFIATPIYIINLLIGILRKGQTRINSAEKV